MDHPTNISLSGLVTTLSLGSINIALLFLANEVQRGAVFLCGIGISVLHISIAIRTASLALHTVVVFIIIKHGLSKVMLPPLTILM